VAENLAWYSRSDCYVCPVPYKSILLLQAFAFLISLATCSTNLFNIDFLYPTKLTLWTLDLTIDWLLLPVTNIAIILAID